MRFRLAALLLLLSTTAGSAQPLRIFAAGSLLLPLREAIAASGLPPDVVAPPVFGPAGALRVRLENGEAAELFLSADEAQPASLAKAPDWLPPVPFARNRMCLLSRTALPADGLVAALTAPGLRLATSTPGNDPGGDYAAAVFDRMDAARPGAAPLLREKALHLLGNPQAPAAVPNHSPNASVFLADRADVLLYYCSSSASTIAEVPGLLSTPVPDAFEPHPVYALTARPDSAAAMRLALFLQSAPGQAILARNGLLPLLDR